jgi:hypothetical protein
MLLVDIARTASQSESICVEASQKRVLPMGMSGVARKEINSKTWKKFVSCVVFRG